PSRRNHDEGGNMSIEEKRKCVRLSIQKVVDFAVWDRAYRGLIENYCDIGVFIKIKGRFSKGQHISMPIEFTGEKRTGKIARVTPRGIGVEFNHPGYERGGQND
ncbi:hypothetical protein LCGC14_2337160, partial [marine sediment metagenome]